MAISEFTDSLPMLLYRASDAVMPRFRRIFNEFGITEQQWRILRVLADEQSLPMRDISRYCLIPAPSLVGIVDRLEKSGLVRRRVSPSDRRRVLVSLSDNGKALHRRLGPEITAAYTRLMQSLGPRRCIDLTSALSALIDCLDNQEANDSGVPAGR